METKDGRERRRHPRVAVSTPVRISTIDPETDPGTGRPFFRASSETCANLSRGGLFIRTNESLLPGSRLLLELRLPDGQPVEAVGRVAWIRGGLGTRVSESDTGIGVELLGGVPDQLSALEDYLTRSESASSG